MAYADQRASDGITRWRTRKIDARLATIEDDLDSGAIGGGGGDGWTYVLLPSDHTNSTTTPTTVPTMQFTPAANKRYEVEAKLFTSAPSSATGAQIGIAWPSGVIAPSAATLQVAQALTNWQQRNYSRTVTTQAQSTSFPNNAAEEALNRFEAIMTTNGSPSGALTFTLDSESGGVTVTMLAGSFIRYREIPTS